MKIVIKKTKYHTHALEFSYDPSLVNLCRELKEKLGWENFGFDVESKSWVFSYPSFETVVRTFPRATYSMLVVEDYTKWKFSKDQETKQLSEALNPVDVEGLPLFEYQKIGVNFINKIGRVLLADEMGLGKSIQVLGAIKKEYLNHILIVCPASLKSNWAAEIEKWNVGNPIIDKFDYITKDAMLFENGVQTDWKTLLPIFITNYEKIDKIPNKTWDLIVFDESHYLKNNKAKRTKSAKKLAKTAKAIVLLTGTPLLNRPVELPAQLDVLGRLEELGGEWKFKMKYCDGHQDKWGHWDFSGSSNLEELKQKLAKFTLRRIKTDVLKDLPDKMVHSTYLDMTDPKAYEKIRKGLSEEMFTAKQEYSDFYKAMKGMTDLERANYLDGLHQNERYKQLSAKTLVLIERLKQESARQKLELLPEILESYGDKKVVVFVQHKETAKQILKITQNGVMITGDVKQEDRMKAVTQFQEDPNCRFIVGTMATMGVGFNLTAASDVLFVELGWTPALHQQAEDRCYRIGQKNNVNINYLILKDSIDEDIAQLLISKSEVIEGAIKGKILDKILIKHLI